MSKAVVLFAHGARDPLWAKPIEALRQQVLNKNSSAKVVLAYLEFMSPTLTECVERLVGENIVDITVIPMFIAAGGHLKNDVPKLLNQLLIKHPSLSIEITEPVGEFLEVQSAIADRLNTYL
jgi:sirohydrochlorin cobaltochelatase